MMQSPRKRCSQRLARLCHRWIWVWMLAFNWCCSGRGEGCRASRTGLTSSQFPSIWKSWLSFSLWLGWMKVLAHSDDLARATLLFFFSKIHAFSCDCCAVNITGRLMIQTRQPRSHCRVRCHICSAIKRTFLWRLIDSVLPTDHAQKEIKTYPIPFWG